MIVKYLSKDYDVFTIVSLLIKINNNFVNYIDTLELKFLSDKYLNTDGKSTAIITNNYGIKFAQEVLTNDISEFKKSLTKRIIRFNYLKNDDFVVYVRIELKPLSSKYLDYLDELVKLLDLINKKYLLKIIIHKDSNIKISLDKVKIYYYNSFSSDWKMSHLNWTKYFTE